MLNIPELEKQWLYYKIKSFIPHAIIVISLSIIIIVLLNITSFESDIPIVSEVEQKYISIENKGSILPAERKNEPRTLQESVQLTVEIPKATQPIIHKRTELKPSFAFMKEMQDSTQLYYNNDNLNNEDSYTPISKTAIPTPIHEEKIEEVVIQPEVVTEEPNKINIERKDTKNDIQEIIQRFNKNKNPALSLFVAKKYYELGDYAQSYNYALITNEINKDIEASWIIFSKSLVKLGKKDMAIKTLREYMKYSHSEGAKLLLNDIISGKFK